jgi:hypothetical protein
MRRSQGDGALGGRAHRDGIGAGTSTTWSPRRQSAIVDLRDNESISAIARLTLGLGRGSVAQTEEA